MSVKYFVALKSKMYTFITETNNQSKKSKCINKNAADSELKTKITKLICSTDHI